MRRLRLLAAGVLAAPLLAACVPSLPNIGGGEPQAPTVNVTVTQTVNGVPAETEASRAQEAPHHSGTVGGADDRAAPPAAAPAASARTEETPPGAGPPPAGPDLMAGLDQSAQARAENIDRAVQAMEALGTDDMLQVCRVLCPGPELK